MRIVCAAMVAAGVIVLPSAGQADEATTSVRAASTLCRVMESTGTLSAPCDISGWHSAVRVSIAISAGEAREVCQAMPSLVREMGLQFGPRWTLEIRSPYSGTGTIAVCPLR